MSGFWWYSGEVSAQIQSATAGTGKIKVYLGSVWTEKPAKYWTGAAWVAKPLKVYDGATWVLA